MSEKWKLSRYGDMLKQIIDMWKSLIKQKMTKQYVKNYQLMDFKGMKHLNLQKILSKVIKLLILFTFNKLT